MDSLNYRPCVESCFSIAPARLRPGAAAAVRSSTCARHEWQMPQGGIDAGEAPYQAALRELREETNVSSTTFLAESPEWYSYDLPDGVLKKSSKGRFHGQRQKWFALRFDGDESEIDIDTPAGGQRPEFDAWRWESIGRLAGLIVPFKRPVYEKVVETFGHLAEPFCATDI